MGDVTVVLNRASVSLLPSHPAVRAVEARVAAEAAAVMRGLCPVSEPGEFHVSGRLRRSIRARRTATGWRVGPELAYGKWVDQGSRPHIIRSHGDYSLHNPETGAYFGKVVHHPGNRGRHFIAETGLAFDGRQYRA